MENVQIGFVLTGVKTEQFAIFEDKFQAKKDVQLTTELQFRTNLESKNLGVYTTFCFESGKNVFIKLQTSCHFLIQEENWNSFISGDEIIFPMQFIRHLAMITIGTSRGILHERTLGTPFNKFFIQTINVEQLVTTNVVFRLD